MLINPNIKQIAYDPKLKKCEVSLECGDELLKENVQNLLELFLYLHILLKEDCLVITKATHLIVLCSA